MSIRVLQRFCNNDLEGSCKDPVRILWSLWCSGLDSVLGSLGFSVTGGCEALIFRALTSATAPVCALRCAEKPVAALRTKCF